MTTTIGCTRDSAPGQQHVTHLNYTAYVAKALESMHEIATTARREHGLTGVSMTHRLGRVDVGDESVVIAVSAPHRGAAWKGGQECLERVKDRVEIWKEEWVVESGGGKGVWRRN